MNDNGIARIRERFWCKGAPDIEQHMEQNGQIDTAAFITYVTAEQSNYKSVGALNHISVKCTEENCLEYICGKKGHGVSGVFQSDAPKDQLFTDGGYQDGI